MDDAQRKRRTWLIGLGLALAVMAAYAPVWRAGFISYDDQDYVAANPHVQGGLTWAALVWAFTSSYASNWHPLTWISHIVDFQFYGLNPLGHHLTNIFLHTANTVLLFLLLQRMTGASWPSACVAALFGLHPMHVESVAWISERKDVLSALFWILSIWAYAASKQKPGAQAKFYFKLSIALFALGLMAKPMLVTLPFVLLLLDYWPLESSQTVTQLVLEKIPFFILSAASCVATFVAQARGGSVVPLSQFAFSHRLANVPVAYVRYVGKTFWPAHLAIGYPMRAWPLGEVAGAAIILLVITGVALALRSSRRWFLVGWLWFLITLLPVIGVVQVGMQSMADRYNYIPSIGLFIAVIWAIGTCPSRIAVMARAVLGALAVALCFVLTVRQAACWKNDQTLFQHAIENSSGNFLAYARLGAYEGAHGQLDPGITHLETAVRLNPGFAEARNDLGHLLLVAGRNDDAMEQLQKAVALYPGLAEAHYNLGYALLAKGRVGDALDQFQMQVNLEPDSFKAQENMGSVLLQNELAADAIPFLEKAMAIKGDDAQARYLLANALFRSGRVRDAVGQYETCLQLNPDHVKACNDLAWILSCNGDPTLRNGTKAVELAMHAEQLSGGQNPVVMGTLAAAYAEAGKFAEAVSAETRARQIALSQTNNTLAELLEERLRAYEAGMPWRSN